MSHTIKSSAITPKSEKSLPDEKTMGDRPYPMKEITELDESWSRVNTPNGFIGELKDHQKTVVRAMLDIEDKRYLELTSTKFSDLTGETAVAMTNALVLSEPFGSGKTIEILAMILLRPCPRATPTYINLWPHEAKKSGAKESYTNEIVRTFTGPGALLRSNVIVVGSPVLEQWAQEIATFTSLKCFMAGNYHKIKDLYTIIENGKISEYDIVLLKNGSVSGNFNIPGDTHQGTNRPIITVFNLITGNRCWARVFYDDFDTVPAGAQMINCLFSIFVSATTKRPGINKTSLTFNSINEATLYRAPLINSVVGDKVLFTNFNIRNNSEFTEKSTQITIIQAYKYVYDNPDDNYIRLIGSMGEEEATRIMEMLNGDAIATAAEAMNIKSNSVSDIFQKMLNTKYEKYLHDQSTLELIDEVMENVAEIDDEQNHSAAELETIRAAIIKGNIPKIEYKSVGLFKSLDELKAEYNALKEKDGLAINRVIDNIKEGDCQVCAMPMSGCDALIVKCCGLIVCSFCGIQSNQISKKYDYRTKTETLVGACANCKSVIYPATSLIFVDRNINLEDLLTAKSTTIRPKPVVVKNEIVVEAEHKNPKIVALLKIIRGQVPDGRESVQMSVKNLLVGQVDKPPSPGAECKILIFANFIETLNLVEKVLLEKDIKFLRLRGSYQEMAQTVKEFKIRGTVLLINSQQVCAGLSLQFATDLIFFHHITDENIKSQVAGRLQRIGRTVNARFHSLCYKNEQHLI